MNFMKKFAAAATAAVMVISTPAASVMAASYTGTDVGISSYGGASIQTGTPNYYLNAQTISNGKKTKEVGESGYYYRLPRLIDLCPRCQNIALEYIPDTYKGVSYTLSDGDVLKDCKFNIKSTPSDFGEYAGYPGLNFDYTAAHPGITDVTLTFYYYDASDKIPNFADGRFGVHQ